MSNKPPIEVPQGAIRLNTDSQRLEFFAQDRWYEMATDSPVLDGGVGRGFIAGGNVPGGKTNGIQSINFATLATDTAFGDLQTSRGGPAGAASRTRGIVAGGGAPSRLDTIDFFPMATRFSGVSASDFGNLTSGRSFDGGGLSSETRAVFAGGTTPSNVNTIDYITISQTGNAVDFGDLTRTTRHHGSCESKTRGLFAGGHAAPDSNVIDFITISTTGNAADFGDTSAACYGVSGCSNAVRGLFGLGNNGSNSNVVEFVTISTLGNTSDFGDLSGAKYAQASCSSSVRGLFGGHYPGNNTIDFFQIMSTGNSKDFGDLTSPRGHFDACSNGHGGL